MAQSSQLTSLYAPINWVAEENIIFGPLATPFVDSWVQRVLDKNYWDCSEAFTKLISRFRLLVRYAESSENGPSNLARDRFMLERLKRTLANPRTVKKLPLRTNQTADIWYRAKSRNYTLFQSLVDCFVWNIAKAFTDRHREEFIKECQGIEYWCKNGNWLQPPSARPKVGEPELPTPQEYSHVQRPYGRIGIGIGSGKNSLSIPLLVPPFRRHELPAMEPPAEARGPPSRFDTRLLPSGPNTYL